MAMSLTRRNIALIGFSVFVLALPGTLHSQARKPGNSCLECHAFLDPPLQVKEQDYARDIHTQKGLTCAACHGGDPTSDENAMSPKAGFRGKIKHADVPKLCARCHSDAAYMRGYNPSLRTDQLGQYVTSVHGRLLAKIGRAHV